MKELFMLFIDLWEYMKATRKIYLTLLIIFFLLMGAVVVLTEGAAIMPFIYTIF